MGATILLIEDDADTARLLKTALARGPDGLSIVTASSASAGLRQLAEQAVDCVLLDYRLPDADGLDCLHRIRTSHPNVPVIMVTGAGSEEIAVEAMKAGATDYVVKHGRYLVTLPTVIGKTLDRLALERRAAHYRHALRSTRRRVTQLEAALRERYRLDGIIGESAAIEQAIVLAEKAAQTDAPVLLEGETGTGKELFARAIHYHGPRARGPFLAQNCASLPDALLESELFGHVRGAFTGAERSHRGLLAEAHGGTLFLDELGEMSVALQAKLLRVLEDGEIRPVGGATTIRVEVRLIAATNRNLREAADKQQFRADLFYRVSVFPIRLPPLRERQGDVRLLALHFLRRFAEKEGKDISGFEPEALRLLEQHPWPGNVRELANVVRRLVLSGDEGGRIPPDLLWPWLGVSPSTAANGSGSLRDRVRQAEVEAIDQALRANDYNRTRTARSLGVTREWLWTKMRRLGFDIGRGGQGPK